jgi:protocatechuate 4,5-dioxygenase beta chain
MAKLVSVLCTPHDPTLPAAVEAGPAAPPGLDRIGPLFEEWRGHLADARPDVLVVASGDHLNQFFYDLVPTLAIGRGPEARGPFPNEVELFRLGEYAVPVARPLARSLLHAGMEEGFDFAWTDDFLIDHGFTVPLRFLRPEQDLPVVPVFTNILVPPVPPGRRFFDLGRFLARTIRGLDDDLRVAVLASGHMTNAIGGPTMVSFSREPLSDWDRDTWARLTGGDVDGLLPRCTWDRLYAQGNGTPGFLVNLVGWGAAGGLPPTWSELNASEFGPPNAFLAWDEDALDRAGGAT